ncbi:hypothetical protein SPRG_07971 [Saprolegnia parasitica CBS 223.65]|uniref:E2F/DP family winged-helix DNA-binding domain-containing protein n=1 Tax=Saprolegnia parasitica (strain CBS 223.65) TaxID=695850 RepID=A0A067CID1_SAPPC|nr:hypothetical protein SPRG_07971 [Saprolegnia parasitica CBS 223.65]KDO26567.1 hypothetical protein SPRG_07971 [Saprolegnia parasitica CBS 223.65]|eukprot:XP_012202709.1 hypothetical protein SPRG_07971 [Saprolegnia parasitica CBS 223.65]
MAPGRAKKTVDVAEKFVSAPALEKTRKATASAKLAPQAVTPVAQTKPARAVTPVAQAKPARAAPKRSLPQPVQNDDNDEENEDDDEDDDDEETKADAVPASTCVAAAASVEPSATPRSLHDDFINLMKVQGLEKMATDAGLLKDGQFRDLKREWDSMNQSFLPLKKADASMPSLPFPTPTPKKKKTPRASATSAVSEKGSKGLRHFSMKVCQKVEEKHVTSYNEVADELVHEFVTMRPSDSVYDEKNIRRRVYDALNVLMAMDIISKEKKEIRWRGLPSNAKQDLELLTHRAKEQQLQELLLQQIALKNLVRRNEADATTAESRIALPFILVNTSKDTVIQCEMSEDRQDVFFNFSGPFEINDDSEILKRMDLHKAAPADVKDLVPEKLLRYLPPAYLTEV